MEGCRTRGIGGSGFPLSGQARPCCAAPRPPSSRRDAHQPPQPDPSTKIRCSSVSKMKSRKATPRGMCPAGQRQPSFPARPGRHCDCSISTWETCSTSTDPAFGPRLDYRESPGIERCRWHPIPGTRNRILLRGPSCAVGVCGRPDRANTDAWPRLGWRPLVDISLGLPPNRGGGVLGTSSLPSSDVNRCELHGIRGFDFEEAVDEIGGRAVEGQASAVGGGGNLQTKRRPGRGFALLELIDWYLCDSEVDGKRSAKRNDVQGRRRREFGRRGKIESRL